MEGLEAVDEIVDGGLEPQLFHQPHRAGVHGRLGRTMAAHID
jgi:hypothetical protein